MVKSLRGRQKRSESSREEGSEFNLRPSSAGDATCKGYYRWPHVQDDMVVFTSEDDLWTVPLTGGIARRLTSGLGRASRPAISPDGKWVAFSGRDEGHTEVYVMSVAGGTPQRLTWTDTECRVLGWTRDQKIVFASAMEQPFLKLTHLWTLDPSGGALPERIEVGPTVAISWESDSGRGGVVIGRSEHREPSAWKRYRGGTAGDIWIDKQGRGDFSRLVKLDGNVGSPMWIRGRIWFMSDHEGVGNLYSCLPSGKDVRRHTHHEEFYIRHLATDGQTIVYSCGADIWRFNPETEEHARIDIDYRSPRMHRARRFVDGTEWLESFDPHPAGHSVATVVRGKALALSNFDGPVIQVGARDGSRMRLLRWANDGKLLIALNDFSGEEQLVVFECKDLSHDPQKLRTVDLSQIGMVIDIQAAPGSSNVALSTAKGELAVVDVTTGKLKVVASGRGGHIYGTSWSSDGSWLAFGFAVTSRLVQIRVWDQATGKVHEVSDPVSSDAWPVFDPEGRWLWFISYRFFDPVYDKLRFGLGFPRGARPCAISLRKEVPSPLIGTGRLIVDDQSDSSKTSKDASTIPAKRKSASKVEAKPVKKVAIDFEGIKDRITVLPVDDGNWEKIAATKDRVYFVGQPIEGSLGNDFRDASTPTRGVLTVWDIAQQKSETWLDGLSTYKLSADGSSIWCRMRRELRVFKADSKPDPAKGRTDRERGNVNLARARVSVDPGSEWLQMYRESWRLQRDFFWDMQMSEIPWDKVYDRYLPLVGRLGSRAEFGDLVWEMQGELGTSHAYEMGGDYKSEPRWWVGMLGARLQPVRDGWEIQDIVRGDPWQLDATSPLLRPGLDVRKGDVITSIDGVRLTPGIVPQQLLVNRAGLETMIGVKRGKSSERVVSIKPLWQESNARRRDYVEHNRRYVHEKSGGRLGYVHVPNMGPLGYSEFWRYYQHEVTREGLVIDVRFNGGGHVSQFLLTQLMQKRLAVSVPRHFEQSNYPEDAPAGPMVALTNEYAGSDGDIFSHAFKMLKLGPLIGKRTWGGVIGIWPRHRLVDGGLTTQPEFSFWFNDVGWNVENYGTDPDIEVEMRPQDWVAGSDPQLDRAIAEGLKLVKAHKSPRPDMKSLPSRAVPRLAKR
jgi:tricorn protease